MSFPPYVPAPAPPKKKSKVGWVIAIIVIITVILVPLLLCFGPWGIFGISALTREAAPHESLPSVCTVMDNESLTELVGDTTPQPSRSEDEGRPRDSCKWPTTRRDTHAEVSITATLIPDSFFAGGIDRATEEFEGDTTSAKEVYGDGKFEIGISGVGDGALCVLADRSSQNSVAIEYRCIARDGNALVELTVEPPIRQAAKPTDAQRLETLQNFEDTARILMNDLIDDL